jgi:hypothetical protein
VHPAHKAVAGGSPSSPCHQARGRDPPRAHATRTPGAPTQRQAAPLLSLHTISVVSGVTRRSIVHATFTASPGAESAPYFAALATSSWNAMLSTTAAEGLSGEATQPGNGHDAVAEGSHMKGQGNWR